MGCSKCDRLIVPPYGERGQILIAGEYPDAEDISCRVPFIGDAGKILRNELGRAGISLDTCRVTNLWLHEVDEKMYDEPGHLDWHLARLLEEIEAAPHIMLLGPMMAQIFLHDTITSICGMELSSPLFPPGKVATFSINPSVALTTSAGELRLACTKFVSRVRKFYA